MEDPPGKDTTLSSLGESRSRGCQWRKEGRRYRVMGYQSQEPYEENMTKQDKPYPGFADRWQSRRRPDQICHIQVPPDLRMRHDEGTMDLLAPATPRPPHVERVEGGMWTIIILCAKR
ncbi:hypothetical protein ABZX51_010313 [Aspergillus tubingensis]